MTIAFDLALLQVAYRGERAGGERRRQRGREDEARRMAAQEIDERRRARDVAADRAEGLSEGALDDGRAVHDTVALGNAAAAGAVKADGVYFVEIGHRAKALGDIT